MDIDTVLIIIVACILVLTVVKLLPIILFGLIGYVLYKQCRHDS